MLEITVPATVIGEQFNEATGEFISIVTKPQTLKLEHSLVSLSKWEAKWHKPFLSREPKTVEESVDYVRCMTMTQNVNSDVYKAITPQLLQEIFAYIDASMTATTISKDPKGRTSREIITAEIIYYWMICQNIPFECQKWHLSRLLTLINVCNAKKGPQRKMSRKELLERNRALNAARRRRAHSRG